MSKGPPTKEGGRSHQDPKQKLTVKTETQNSENRKKEGGTKNTKIPNKGGE